MDIPVYLKRQGTLCRQNILRGVRERLVKFHRSHNPDRAALLRLINTYTWIKTAKTKASLQFRCTETVGSQCQQNWSARDRV